MKPSTILMRRIGGGLFPAEDKAAEMLLKLRPRVPVAIRVLRHRSPEQTALYWRCLERVVEATGKWRTPEELHLALKVATGRVDVVRLLDGRRVLVPESIAFDAMTQDEATAYFDAALRIVCDELMGGISVEELLEHAAPRRAA
jgi:hypothetical protein